MFLEINDDLAEIESDEKGEEEKDELVCIFCEMRRKKFKGRWLKIHQCSAESTVETIKSQATELNDATLLQKIQNLFSKNHAIFYHNNCHVNFNSTFRSRILKGAEKTEWHQTREVRNVAFDKIYSYINDKIVSKNGVCFLDFLQNLYIDYLKLEAQVDDDMFYSRYLEQRILNKFCKKVSIIKIDKRKIVKPFSGVMINSSDLIHLENQDIVQRAALILPREILGIKKDTLPEHLKASDFIKGECTVPNILNDFYTTLLSGSEYRRKRSPNTKRSSDSFSQDVIHAVTNGNIKPAKHITLGMCLKALTNSKNIINILNRFGHCSSYTILEGLETEATFSSTSRTDVCPEDILRTSNLCTSLAFNNFDRFVDTASGKDTLHDTVGIIFQHIAPNADNIMPETESNNENPNANNEISKKRRRTFDTIIHELEPYTKRPKVIETLLPLSHPQQLSKSQNLTSVQRLDKLWMLTHALQVENTPMWVGYNSLIYDDKSEKQKISYLTTINHSPTSTHVVFETMMQSLRVAEECEQLYMQVTYDLGIAKIAFQLQSTEKPKFDKLFIHIGPFHIMMAFFKAIGKFIDNCGITNIIVDSNMLATGLVNGFLTGKHFNRCKRLHPLVSLAIQILHFENFLKTENI